VKFAPDNCTGLGTLPKSVDFNDPSKAIGAGPFKLAEYTRGTQLVLERNDNYWGAKPNWSKVTFRPITSAGPRVAALLAGDVDMIENPPIQDLDRIKKGGYQVVQQLSNRVIYLALDQSPDRPQPGIKGTDKNPFTDKRVREAVSKAINRQAIVDRVMSGIAVPAGDLLPHPLFGTRKDTPVEKYDPEAAKKLLAAAGFANGFELVLGSPNDRYINDDKIAQALAQMLTRVGIKTTVDAMTASTFFSNRNKGAFSAYMAGWGAGTGEMGNPLNALVHTRDPKRGRGSTNFYSHSNKAIDEIIEKALGTVDENAREKLLQEAATKAMAEYAVLPLHFEVTPWAFKKGLAYNARVDQYTLAAEVTPAK
jgi:peptide/nickel transport system substrate-binding protein